MLELLEAHSSLQGVAIDGKILRESKRHGAIKTHLLSAVALQLGTSLAQTAVANKAHEIAAMLDLLSGLVVEGHAFSKEALLTQ